MDDLRNQGVPWATIVPMVASVSIVASEKFLGLTKVVVHSGLETLRDSSSILCKLGILAERVLLTDTAPKAEIAERKENR